ncbi:hypothetical protein KAH81_00465 [bacterium]|nr:hypothetical protein [bacterium]
MDNIKNEYWWLWELLRRWKLIIFGAIIVAILSFGIASFFPKWYQAEAEVMPPYRGGTELGAMANLMTGIMSMGGGGGDYVLPMMVTPSDLWSAIVSSNAMVDTLISEFSFDVLYEQPIREKLHKAVREHMDTEVTGQGILKVRYEAKNPAFAANVTNTIVDNLDFINRDLRSGSAGATRGFIEQRLEETKKALSNAESNFSEFQKENGAFSMEDQTRVAIESVAQLEAEIHVAQVELAILTSTRKAAHGEVEQVISRIKTLNNQIEGVKSGEGISSQFGLIEIPELAIEYARLYRETMIQEVLYEYLVQQHEQASIEEKKDTPVLQRLSRAKIPEKKYRPKRSIITLLALIGGGILLSIWVLGSCFLERMKTTKPEKYRLLTDSLAGKKQKKENL